MQHEPSIPPQLIDMKRIRELIIAYFALLINFDKKPVYLLEHNDEEQTYKYTTIELFFLPPTGQSNPDGGLSRPYLLILKHYPVAIGE